MVDRQLGSELAAVRRPQNVAVSRWATPPQVVVGLREACAHVVKVLVFRGPRPEERDKDLGVQVAHTQRPPFGIEGFDRDGRADERRLARALLLAIAAAAAILDAALAHWRLDAADLHRGAWLERVGREQNLSHETPLLPLEVAKHLQLHLPFCAALRELHIK